MDTSAMDIPNSRAIAKQLLVLSQDPDNQPFICQEEGCLAGLAGYLDHWELEIVLMASRALQFLSSNPANKERIKTFPGLVEKLHRLHQTESTHKRAKEFARATLENLNEFNETKKVMHHEAVQDENTSSLANMQQPSSENTFENEKVATTKSIPYQSVALQVDQLGNSLIASQVKKALFQVQGVISVVISADLGRATIGLRWAQKFESPTDALLRAIASTGTKACVWPSSKSSQKQTAIPFAPITENDENDGYQDEDEEDGDVESGDNAVTRFGDNSLSARLERQRQEEERNARLISKVSNAFSNAGSWLMGW